MILKGAISEFARTRANHVASGHVALPHWARITPGWWLASGHRPALLNLRLDLVRSTKGIAWNGEVARFYSLLDPSGKISNLITVPATASVRSKPRRTFARGFFMPPTNC